MNMKTMVITGAASGIGYTLCQKAVNEGWHVIAIDNDDAVTLQQSDRIKPIHGDISSSEFWNIFHNELTKDKILKDSILSLVNCAAIMHKNDSFIDSATHEIWSSVLSANVIGTMLSCKNILPLIRNKCNPSIVTLSSIVAYVGSNNPQLAYTSSKGAIISFTKELAISEAQNNVRINSISPGLTLTPMIKDLQGGLDKRAEKIPLGRIANTDDICSLIIFLTSDNAKYITAADYIIDGGLSAVNPTTIFTRWDKKT